MTRIPQHQRSAETVAKLLDATLDLLHDRGLARLSTADIAKSAGVSRGALTHHFDSKEAIIADAVIRQLRACTAALHDRANSIRRNGGSSDELVDYIWRMINDRLFYVTVEYLPEARHNSGFRHGIMLAVKEFHEGLNTVWRDLAEKSGVEVERALVLMNATVGLMRGMIAQTTVKDDPSYFATLLAFRKDQVQREFRASYADPASRLTTVHAQ
ncbi:TetR/AcrR family transcriptional regulator [Roseomonas sp. GCM10028921]